MCTLAVALRTDPRWPIVVAANRDERLGRPAEGWAIRRHLGSAWYAAPRDLVAGGTWIGVSAVGVFAAVTNFHAGPGFPDPTRRSRGELVPRALRHADALAARAELSGEDAVAYNPFHLLVADARHAFLWHHDGARSGLTDLSSGLHVVTEVDPIGRCERGEKVRACWPEPPELAGLAALMTQHATARGGTCIHLDPHYGTRSSTLLRLGPDLARSDLHVANGHPCITGYEDASPLLAALVPP